ncbi:MAG: ATP-binding cassette domain-containing protein [Bacteroidales bacterium]|nr:ATP-binding cassette domain-containing protein [Bacteroidales bacterium]
MEIKTLEIPTGKSVFIVGESGIGKSTMLETLGLMNDTIVRGDADSRFLFNGSIDMLSLWNTNDDEILSDFRCKYYSFIFQSTNLMRNFTAYENAMYPRLLQGYSLQECQRKASKVFADLGLEQLTLASKAQALSGGQQQRLAFARAILPDFTVLFGDEPTGNLDSENAYRVMGILKKELEASPGASSIIVSHDMPLAMTFGDVIVKIHKRVHEKMPGSDETPAYGLIDETSVYTKAKDGQWVNCGSKYTGEGLLALLRKAE